MDIGQCGERGRVCSLSQPDTGDLISQKNQPMPIMRTEVTLFGGDEEFLATLRQNKVPPVRYTIQTE